MRIVTRDGEEIEPSDCSEYRNKDKQRETGDSSRRDLRDCAALSEADSAPLDDTVVLVRHTGKGGNTAYHEAETDAPCVAKRRTDVKHELSREEAKEQPGLFPCQQPGCRSAREEREGAGA